MKTIALFALMFLVGCNFSFDDLNNENNDGTNDDSTSTEPTVISIDQFDATTYRGGVELNWDLPTDLSNFQSVVIKLRYDKTPEDIFDGQLVYKGYAQQYFDNDIRHEDNALGFYKIFILAKDGSIFDGPDFSIGFETITNLTNTRAVGLDGKISLSWQNPLSKYFENISIRRNLGTTAPNNTSEGDEVYLGSAQTFLDTGPSPALINDADYSYTIFAIDDTNQVTDQHSFTITPKASGTIDTTIGLNGFVYYNNENSLVRDILLDDQGRMLILSTKNYDSGDDEIRLLRLTSDGAIDTSFASFGLYQKGGTEDPWQGEKLLALDNGRFLVIGSSASTTSAIDSMVMMFTENGDLYDKFGVEGVASFNNLLGYHPLALEQALDSAIDSKGNVYIAGRADDGSATDSDPDLANFHLFLIKIASDGSLDENFGTNGIVVDESIGATDSVNIAINQHDEIYVAGSFNNYSETWLWSFDGSGQKINLASNPLELIPSSNQCSFSGGESSVAIEHITIDATDDLYLAGSCQVNADHEAMLVKVDRQGVGVNAFSAGSDFTLVIDSGMKSSFEFVTLDDQNRILLSGLEEGADYKGVFWRLNADGTTGSSFAPLIIDNPQFGFNGSLWDDRIGVLTIDPNNGMIYLGGNTGVGVTDTNAFGARVIP